MLNPLKVHGVLKRISDEDCQLLGLNPKYARPDWMILQVLPIPPPHVRPSVMMDTSSRSEASVFLHCSYVFSVFYKFHKFLLFNYPLPLTMMTDNIFRDNFDLRLCYFNC